MTKKIDDWLDDVPESNENEEDDEIIWVSKSEIKRDAEALKDLGQEMVDLGKNSLDKLPLDDDLRAAAIEGHGFLRCCRLAQIRQIDDARAVGDRR